MTTLDTIVQSVAGSAFVVGGVGTLVCLARRRVGEWRERWRAGREARRILKGSGWEAELRDLLASHAPCPHEPGDDLMWLADDVFEDGDR